MTRQHPYSTSVAVTGGKATNSWWQSSISSKAFTKAISDSIETSGVFVAVVQQGGSDYKLEIKLVKLMQPLAGFNMTATAVTKWLLTEASSGKVVSEEFISTPFTATVGDAFAGAARIRMATEGAGRENIKEGIRRLSELALPAKAAGN